MTHYLYAIRNKKTGKIVRTGPGQYNSKTWYPAVKWANDRITKYAIHEANVLDKYEIVKFELVEVEIIQPNGSFS
jgi:hypothetical protein